MENNGFSLNVTVFHGRRAPEDGVLVGYGALIDAFDLDVPMPDQLAWISTRKRQYQTQQWQVLTSRHAPGDTLYKQLIFAFKYEGVNLLFFKKLFEVLNEKDVIKLITEEPTGQYSRKIWFLYEWLMQKELSVPNLGMGNFVFLLDEKLQYALSKGIRSSRHRIINNLPGTVDFCPLIRRTPELEKYIDDDLSVKNEEYVNGVRKSILQRAAAFLLLQDSKASFTIEGESPKSKRAARWGKAIGQAGMRDLDHREFERLQQIVIENTRFIDMGYRQKGGFIGERDRDTFSPIPDHISAKHEDITRLMRGLIEAYGLLLSDKKMDSVLAAASIAFGFVFIHPFVDGNGRIHRYLIHHVLAGKKFTPQGLIFPVSASILNQIIDYKKVLERYSVPLLDFIEWKEAPDHNVVVTNKTIDYYRYFDATPQAEFLYRCVKDTVENIIPEEVNYLMRYEEFKSYIDNAFEMSDDQVALLVRFLEQNDGKLSKRARKSEFSVLKVNEINEIEKNFLHIMS
ncbi:Fic family protein [Membranihabitans maritimus]|uniref:Fic family protein n=1 Tax=Membranihabitans maritimus TaxID=2904244 RepID=UPI001F410CC8|nr:Fic family protein [Membranihabitans maritimus]